MKILFVTPYVPSRIRCRSYHLIRALLDLGHELTLIAAAEASSEQKNEIELLTSWGIQVETFPVSRTRSLINCVRAIPTDEPFQAVYAYHPAMEHRMKELLHTEHFDIVHVEHLRAARLVRSITDVPAVYDSVDSISLLFEQTMRTARQPQSRLRAWLDLARTRRYEAHLLTRYAQVAVTAMRDKSALEELGRRYLSPQEEPAPVTVITQGVDTRYFAPQHTPRDNRTVVLTGKMSYHANVAAAIHFVQNVLPHIWEVEPEVRFQIVGRDPSPTLKQLAADPRIDVTGYVHDLRPYLARATAAVCPVLYAAGVQIKVLEAMAMGTPVVSSPQGSAGTVAQPDRDVLIAQSPGQMADAVLRLIKDRKLSEQLSLNGRRYVETNHSWTASAKSLLELYDHARRAKVASVRSHNSSPLRAVS